MRLLPTLLMATALSATFFSCDDDEKYNYTAIDITGDWKETREATDAESAGHSLYALNANGTASETVYTLDENGNAVWGFTTFSLYSYTDGDGIILIKNKMPDPESGDKSYYANDTLYVKHITTDPILTILDVDNKSHNWSRTDETVDRTQIVLGTWKKNTWDGVVYRTFAADGTGKEVSYSATGQAEEKAFNYGTLSVDGKMVLNYGDATTVISISAANVEQIMADETPASGEEHTYSWFKVDDAQPEFTNSVAATWKETTPGGDAIIRTFGPNGKFREHSFTGNIMVSENTYDYVHGNDNMLVTVLKIGDFVMPSVYTIKQLGANEAVVADPSEDEMTWTKVNLGYEKLIGKWTYEYTTTEGEETVEHYKTFDFNMDDTGLYSDSEGKESNLTFTFINGMINISFDDATTEVWTLTSISKTRLVITNGEGESITFKKVVEE